MNVNVGSTNESKLQAVREVIAMYDFLSDAIVVPVKVESGVSAQPKSLDDTVMGAMNRARRAFKDCSYSIGLESGLMQVPYTRASFMDVGVCVVYNGKEFYTGLSPAFEPPGAVVQSVLCGNLDLNQASYKAGLTTDLNIGATEGLINILTKGRLSRKDSIKPSLITAMIGVERAREREKK
jgi:inosine/xanthosine triphosphatase